MKLKKHIPLSLFIANLLFTPTVYSAQQSNMPSNSTANIENQNQASQVKPLTLPNPLTLPQLLTDFSALSPSIKMQKAQLGSANAELNFNQVGNNLEFNIEGRLGRREFAEENLPHNLLALHVGKVIYDFGRNDNQFESDSFKLEQAEVGLQNAENRQRLEVAKSYFNVLLADFQFRIDNEAMAIDFINFDKVTDRHAIGQLSDVDLLEAEHNYEKSLLQRSQSEQAQLKTRVALANTLGMPNARPDELKFPGLKTFDKRDLKEVSLEQLQSYVLENNPQMQQWLLAAEAQQKLLQKAQDVSKPSVRADAWVGQLSSQPEVREGRWKAQISVDIPLYDGGLKQSSTAVAKSELQKIQAQKQQLAQNLRNQVADIYFQLKLLAAEKKVNQAFGDYADLYLDYSRALYENESKTDLGDSFVRLSQANYNVVAWQFKQALLWMELDYLSGHNISLENSQPFVVAKQKGNE